ncbi:M15 family metallopeptidase [Aurantivibrio infirmus]
MMTAITDVQVLGQSEDHLVFVPEFDCLLHIDVVSPLRQLASLAKKAGFELAVASSFRSFDRQRDIWNAKATGSRPVLDDEEREVDISRLNGWSLVQSILRWSALPGASRHHWGTDLDVYDKAAMVNGYELQLTAAETKDGGPFVRFHQWLTAQIDSQQACDFVRPYAVDRGGVACEPWHISYKPVAKQFEKALSADLLWKAISKADLSLGDEVLKNLPEIHQRYISANLA